MATKGMPKKPYQPIGRGFVRENNILPREIMLMIFSMPVISRRDLSALGCTCKYWLQISRDDSLGWMDVAEYVLNRDINKENDKNIKWYLDPNGRMHCGVNPRNPQAPAPGMVGFGGFGFGFGFGAPVPAPVPDPEPATKVVADSPEEEASVLEKPHRMRILEKVEHTYYRRNANEKLPFRGQVTFEILGKSGKVLAIGFNTVYEDRWLHMPFDAAEVDPKLWRCTGTIKPSQSRWNAHAWEQHVFHWKFEINTRRLEHYVHEHLEIPGLQFLLPAINHLVVTAPQYNIQTLLNTFNPLIVHTPSKTFSTDKQPDGFRPDLKLHKYQREAVSWMKTIEDDAKKPFEYLSAVAWKGGRTDVMFDLDAQVVLHPSETDRLRRSFCAKGGVLADEMGLGKTMEILGLILANPPGDLEQVETDLLPVKTTLVLCPGHLAKQWQEEIETNSEPKLKVIVIPTVAPFKKLTMQDIADADVVVLTKNVLTSPNFPGGVDVESRYNTLRNAFKKRKTLNGAAHIEQIRWHRIVVDEAHESMVGPASVAVQWLESTYSWWVSGTPFPNQYLLVSALTFLGIEPISQPPGTLPGAINYRHYVESDLLLHNLFWRNTKESAKSDWQIPDTLKELVMLDFSPIETVFYHWVETPNAQRDVCGDIGRAAHNSLYMDANNLTDLKTKLAARMKNDEKYAKETVKNAPAQIAAAEASGDQYRLRSAKNNLEHAQKRLAHITKIRALWREVMTKDGKVADVDDEMDAETPAELTVVLDDHPKSPSPAPVIPAVTRESSADAPALKKVQSAPKVPEKEEEKKPEEKPKATEQAEKKEEKQEDKKEKATEPAEEISTNKRAKRGATKPARPAAPAPKGRGRKAAAVVKENEEEKDEEKGDEKEPPSTRGGRRKAAAKPAAKPAAAPAKKTAARGRGKKAEPEPEPEEEEKVEEPKKAGKRAAPAAKAKPAAKKGRGKAKGANESDEEGEPTEPPEKKEKVAEEKVDAAEEPLPHGGLARQKSLSVTPAIVKAMAALDAQLTALVRRLGTKQAHLIIWLKKLFLKQANARAILFSQYSHHLRELGEILERNDVPCVFVEGNVFRKLKALREFKEEDSQIKVIMLSLDKAAAGSNLMEATHVVLLDPMIGTKKEAQAYESQAIGRAYRQGQKNQVTVVRFIIRKTIEHELFLRNTEDEQKKPDGTEQVIGARTQPVRTTSVAAVLAATPALKRGSSLITLLDQKNVA